MVVWPVPITRDDAHRIGTYPRLLLLVVAVGALAPVVVLGVVNALT